MTEMSSIDSSIFKCMLENSKIVKVALENYHCHSVMNIILSNIGVCRKSETPNQETYSLHCKNDLITSIKQF